MKRALALLVQLVLVAGAGLALAGCQSDADSSAEDDGEQPAGTKPEPTSLPPLSLRDDTKDLLLTWLDDKGDFHVVQRIEDVPKGARAKVRVVVTTRPEGTGQRVYVADLRNKGPDGTYPVTTKTRAEWEELGAKKRQARLEALAPSAKPALAGPKPSGAAPGEVQAVVYGADWCKPCHQAEALLERLGVHVQMKNIEKNPAAHREMQAKLLRANKPGASIPVIDIMGTIIVGYNAAVLKRAVERAKQSETL